MTTPSGPRSLRVLGVVVKTIACAVTFVLAALGGVLIHLNLPIVRRVAMVQVSSLLASTFEGRVTIETLGGLSLHGIRGLSLHLRDPKGHDVLSLRSVEVDLSVVGVVRSAIGGKGPIAIDLGKLTIDDVDANLDADEKGNLELLDALESRDKTPADPHARGLRIAIAQVLVKHAWAHGQMPGAPALDVGIEALTGSVLVSPTATHVDVDQVAIEARGMPNGINPKGLTAYHLAMPSASGADMGMNGTFNGDCGGIPVSAIGSMDGARIDAIVDGPRTTAEALRALVRNAPIYDDVIVHAEVHGALPDLVATAHVGVGKGTLDSTMNVTVGTGKKVHASIDVRGMDVRSFSPTAPASTLDLVSTVNVVVDADDTIKGDFDGAIPGGRIGTNELPHATIHGTFAKTKEGPRAHLDAAIAESGAPMNVVVDMHTEGSKSIVGVAAHIRAPNLEAVKRIGPIARGSARADITGTIHLDEATFEAKLDADLDGLDKQGLLTLHHARVEGEAKGAFADPWVDVAVHGDGLAAQGLKLTRVGVRGRGHVAAPSIDVELVPEDKTISPINAHADLQLRGAKRMISLTLDGLGASLGVEAKMGRGSLEITATSKDVDLGRIARLTNRQAQVKSGHLALDIDLKATREGALGHILLDLSHANVPHVPDANAHIDLDFLDRRLIAIVRADLGNVGHAYFTTTTLALGGAPLDLDAWKRSAGKVQIDAKLDLGKVTALLPAGVLPFGEMGGKVDVIGEIGRATASDPPNLSLSIKTRALVLAAKSPPSPPPVPGTSVVAPPAWRTTGVDVELDAKLDAGTGKIDLKGRVLDKDGTIASLDLDSTLPYRELFANPDTALKRLEALPVSAKLAVPRRAFNRFPPAARTKGIHGDIELSADVEGTAGAPKVDLSVHAKGVRSAGTPFAIPINADATLHYEGHEGKLEIAVATKKEHVLDGTVTVHAIVADFLDHPVTSSTPWDATAQLHASNFPIESLSMLTDRDVRGKVSGDVSLDGLHDNARAKAALRLGGLQIGQALYTGGAVNLTVDGISGTALVRLDQKDGFAEAKAALGTTWGAALAPGLDRSKPISASFRAHGFRAAAILPFVAGTFNELDGLIDADAHIALAPGGAAPKIDGKVAFREGLIQLPSLGEEFHKVGATLSLSAGGAVRIDNVVAYGTTGKITATAQGQINGLTFHDAKASLDIPRKQPLPLNVQGVEIGEAYGHVDITAAAVAGGIDLGVNIPHWHTALPETSKHTVQDLDRAKYIRIGVHRGEDRKLVLLPLDAADVNPEAPRAADAAKITVRVKLGNDVEIKQGSTLKVSLTGNPVIVLTDKARVSGQIQLKTGTIEVQGKRFSIESGTVSFVGKDSTNPEVVATASWTAPEGTKIFADFTGPVRTGKVTLRSEPSRPNSEILALIVFGTADGANATAPPDQKTDPTTEAVGVGGGVATQGLNKAINDLTGVDNAQFRVDTTNSANPRPELEVQIAKDISVGVATVLGVPPPDQPDTVFAQADWRIHRNWSLETMFGNLGTTMVDAVWDYRY